MPMLFGSVHETFEADEAQQGMLQSVFMFGMMLALLVSGYVTEAITLAVRPSSRWA